MVIGFTVLSSVVDDNNLELMGVSDLQVLSINGADFLFVAAEADSAVSSFRLGGATPPALVDSISYDATAGPLAQITIAMVGAVPVLVPSGRYNKDTSTYYIDNTANFSTPMTHSSGSGGFGNFLLSESVVKNGNTFLYASRQGVDGIGSYHMALDGSVIPTNGYTSADFDFIGDVAAFASATIKAKTFLFSASAFDAGINSFRVAGNGGLFNKDAVAPGDGSGFSVPQALETTLWSGKTYLVMASAGSNSLTVYKVTNKGKLIETDHLIDSLDTRFADASVLESFSFNGRSFILAAGSDDGLTLLELHSGGILSVISVLADDFDTTLNNITDIAVAKIAAGIDLFVGSGTERGFTQFRLELDTLGQSFIGHGKKDILSGTAQDDILFGHNGRDRLFGNDGDDRLVDGRGIDRLHGGAGADVFQFIQDGKKDIIRDYQPGVDLIDLSQFSWVSHLSSLTIKSRAFGASIIVDHEVIRIETADGTRLHVDDFTMDDFMF